MHHPDEPPHTLPTDQVQLRTAPDALAGEMRRAGLSDVGYVLMAGSIIAIHVGTVPAGRAR